MLFLRRQIQITRGFWNLGEGAVVDLDVAAVLRSPNLRIQMIDSKMFQVQIFRIIYGKSLKLKFCLYFEN